MNRLIFIVLLSLLSSFATAQTVAVGSASAQCGRTANIAVSVGGASGLLSIEFRIAYDAARLTPSSVTAGTLTSSFSLAYNATGGVLRVAMASGTAVSGSGTVANVVFTAADNAEGAVPLSISNIMVNDNPVTGTSGALTLTCPRAPAAPVLVFPANFATNINPPVTLRWDAVAEATSYRVYFGTSSNPPLLAQTTATSRAVTTETGTRYYWLVQSVSDDGTTSSGVRSFTTAGPSCETLIAPDPLNAPEQVSSGSSFDLSWVSVANASEYIVEESTVATFEGATATTVSSASTRLSLVRSVTSDTTLHFRVKARNATSPCNTEGPFSRSVAVRVTRRLPLATGTRVIPVVGAAPGGFGSYFRTSIQLHNPTGATLTGRLVFHRQGVEGTANDPFLTYSLNPGETVSYPDIIAVMGVGVGIGSLDVVSDSGVTPLSVVRVFNDGGPNGTAGMTLDQLSLADAIQPGQRGILVAPIDPNRARMNIGIRTLLDGVSMTITVRDKRGAMINSVRVSYPPTYFVQSALTDIAAATLLGDEVILIEVETGSVMIYGSNTDNITQDPSVQIARPLI